MTDSQIEYDDFAKVAMVTGRVLKVEEFPRARVPSYKVLVDFGDAVGQRWSSMQAARDYRPEDLLDTLVVRSLLVPALVHELDHRTWWPSRLGRRTP